ncbi:MAG: hypothetical protein IKL62_03955 [Clostridia bacterium]|nr:hypothetical protein [Oscillospiraceae bacterium]MBR6694082.1 hypothetical protein [Clostridia bacterium]
MCYFLYGALNEGINSEDYKAATENSKYHFNLGREKDVNDAVRECDAGYRITVDHCDCENAIGAGDINRAELAAAADLLLSLKKVRGIKYVLLSKNWWEKENNEQKTVHIDDIDILSFLAELKENCLYKIELYPRFC